MEHGHTDIQHSTDRMSNRYNFFSKLKLTMKQSLKDRGGTFEVTVKELFAEYQDAEKAKKKGKPPFVNEPLTSKLLSIRDEDAS